MKSHLGIASLCILIGSVTAMAADDAASSWFAPGNLVLSRSVYDNNSNNVAPGEVLPPGCANTQGGCSASSGAPNDGTYPLVWNNALYDGSFGITSKILLDQLTRSGSLVNTLEV